MATLASIFNWFSVASSAAEARANGRSAVNEDCRLRALPNEDVYFFVKRIDNSRVQRQADPIDRARTTRVALAGGGIAAILIAALLPGAYGMIAGYQINQLRAEHQRLLTQRAVLQLEEARLVSPERLQELAAAQSFVEPQTGKIVYLPGKNDSSLALNRH
jgi:hypothetical protein